MDDIYDHEILNSLLEKKPNLLEIVFKVTLNVFWG